MKFLLHDKRIQGFTLVELLVVLGLFSSIATLSLGALFNAQSVNARLQETQAILDNINLSSQTLTRDIRFGSDFYCAQSLPVPALIPTVRKNCVFGVSQGSVLIFKASDAEGDLDRIAYYVSNGVLYKNIYQHLATTSVLQMTSDDVAITSLTFNVSGAQTSTGIKDEAGAIDYQQPLIKVLISGVTRPVKASTPPATFNLETAVSAREIDNQ